MASRRKDLSRATRLYRSFREASPTRAKSISLSLPKALTVMGRVSAIEYETTHGSESKAYRHKFSSSARPLLCASGNKGQLYLLRGSFRATARGIVDIDSRGREEK